MNQNHAHNASIPKYQVGSEVAEDLAETIKYFPHQRFLRTLGQVLQRDGFTEFELSVDDQGYVSRGAVVAQNGASPSLIRKIFGLGAAPKRAAKPLICERRYSISDIVNIEGLVREQRTQAGQMPDPHSLSQLLRGVGCFLDKREGSRLRGVTVKDRWVSIDYMTADGREQTEKQDLEYFYDFWVKMYLQRRDRSKLPPPNDPTLFVTWEGRQRLHKLSRLPA